MATRSIPEEGSPNKKPMPFPARFTNPPAGKPPMQVPNNKRNTPKPVGNPALLRRMKNKTAHEQHMEHEAHLAHLNHMNRNKS